MQVKRKEDKKGGKQGQGGSQATRARGAGQEGGRRQRGREQQRLSPSGIKNAEWKIYVITPNRTSKRLEPPVCLTPIMSKRRKQWPPNKTKGTN